MTRAPRDLRLLAGAVLLSAAGDLLLVVVLALRVHDLTGSGLAVAALFGSLMAPIVVLAPVAGRLVDRTETRRLLLLVSLARVNLADHHKKVIWRAGVCSLVMLAVAIALGVIPIG